MENAVDALKLAFGILIFVIAISLAISVIGQARTASEVVFHSNDKTEFYEYATSDNISNDKDRIVGIETIIPTIHRYAKEQFAVTIFDRSGSPIVRYDLWTEGFMANWNDIVKNYKKTGTDEDYEQIKDRFSQIQKVVYETINKPVGEFDIEDTINKLYPVKCATNRNITVGAPWIGDYERILERIKCDMIQPYNGNNTISINNITYTGKNLKQYNDNKFIEKFLEVTTSGVTIIDAGDSLETIKGNKKLEIIYIIK